MPAIRILIADDHHLFRTGLVSMFASRPDVQVIGEAADGAEAVQKTLELNPDVVLLDVYMPVMSGLEALGHIRTNQPAVKVIMLTASVNDSDLLQALQAGAHGYLLKTSEPDDLFRSLRSAMAGQATVSGLVAAELVQQMSMGAKPSAGPDALTHREIEVLCLVAEGATNKEIAARLNITVNTVKNHLREILAKLQLQNRTQAAGYALREGIVAPKKPGDARTTT